MCHHGNLFGGMMSDNGKILGVNKRYYPTHIDAPGVDHASECTLDWSTNPPGVFTVLVAGEIGDYAAYTGIGPVEWVARHGDKICFEEACVHFPGGQLKKELYRD